MIERLDIILVKRNFAKSRAKAKDMIISGLVYVNDTVEEKPGSRFEDDTNIIIKGDVLKYVSRGGLKLDKALVVFNINIKNKVCMDIGASTGGFTDCMLQNGAKKVYAIDVGYNQLDDKLRTDKRVISMEKINIKHMTQDFIQEPIEFVAVDVSFISLTKVLLPIKKLINDDTHIVCLLKPQFEVGKAKIGKKGVVHDRLAHITSIKDVVDYGNEIGLYTYGMDYSPIKGGEGNVEYLLHMNKSCEFNNNYVNIKEIVEKAKKML